jgi:hypothetical protein
MIMIKPSSLWFKPNHPFWNPSQKNFCMNKF